MPAYPGLRCAASWAILTPPSGLDRFLAETDALEFCVGAVGGILCRRCGRNSVSAVGGVPCRRWAESVSLLRRVPSATSGDRRSRANATCSTERQREVRRIWRQEAAGTICRLRVRGRLRSSKLDPVLKAHKPLSQSHSRDSATTFASSANSDSSVCVRTLSSPGLGLFVPPTQHSAFGYVLGYVIPRLRRSIFERSHSAAEFGRWFSRRH